MNKENKNYALLLRAVAFASQKHKDQRRKDIDASPYINHPIALADLLANEGEISDIEVLCAAILHDTIEDTQTTKEELVENFGEQITSIVLEVTDDKLLPKDVRKQMQIEHSANISFKAKLVKLADKICNIKDIINSPPKDWSAERKIEYFEWASKIITNIRGTNAKLEAIFDMQISNGLN